MSIASDSTASSTKQLNFEFRGETKEFFNIWIVNLCLSILTLGIYSAWAKVRTKRYFYGNTYLDGTSFEYHANPKAILKGRMVMGLVFLITSTLIKWQPILAPLVYLVFLGVVPWVIVRGMIFNNTNTSYRSVRFGFEKDYKEAYKYTFYYFLLALFTFGLGLPLAEYFRVRYLITKSKFGNANFKFSGQKNDFYSIYIASFCIGLAVLAAAGGLSGLIYYVGGTNTVIKYASIIQLLVTYPLMILLSCYFITRKFNMYWENTIIDGVHFYPNMKLSRYYYIFITNLFAVILSLGFLTPWAFVRLAKYKASCMYVMMDAGKLEQIEADYQSTEGHYADAATDFWDIDVGFW